MIMTVKVFVRLLDKTTGTTKGYYLMDNLGDAVKFTTEELMQFRKAL